MKTAIIGLPMTGKTSLFTILTGVHQETRIGSTAVRTGIAKVPDARLDALAQAVRAAQDHARHGGIPRHALHLQGDPARSRPTWPACAWSTRSRTCCASSPTRPFRMRRARWTRCAIWRMSRSSWSSAISWWWKSAWSAWTRIARRSRIPKLDREFELLEKCKALLEADTPLRQLELDAEDEKRIRGFQFLSQKPMLYVLNIGERRRAAAARDARRSTATVRWPAARTRRSRPSAARSKRSWPNCRAEEAGEYLASYGLKESGLERLISATYSLLGLMSFLTAGEDEVPRLDHPHEQHRGEGGRAPSTPISRRSSSAPKW